MIFMKEISKRMLYQLPKNRALSVEEQRQAAEDWYDFLTDETDTDRPVVNSFNQAWDYLSGLYTLGDKCVVQRGAASAKVARAPLEALFYYIESGFYPPPELLFALRDAWREYENSAGDISLEEAFLGKPKPKAGNYAKQSRTRFKKMMMSADMDAHVRSGLTRIEAAERISEKWNGSVEPETIARTIKPLTRKYRKK